MQQQQWNCVFLFVLLILKVDKIVANLQEIQVSFGVCGFGFPKHNMENVD